MALTYKQAQDEIIGRIHESHEPNSAVRIRARQWLNLARMDLLALNPDGWYFMAKTATITLVASTIEYSLATDFDKINPNEVRLTTTQKRLSLAPDKDLEFLISASEFVTPATPKVFRILGYQKIRLHPAPNAAAVSAEGTVTYEYFSNSLTDMATDGAALGVPQKFEPVVVDLAEVYAQIFAGHFDGAGLAASRAVGKLQALAPNNTSILRLSAKQIVGALRTDKAEQSTGVDRS